ncbi:MAG: gliding motility-associated C-terminal domain-containing protein [Flavobacteriaceae bacterium]
MKLKIKFDNLFRGTYPKHTLLVVAVLFFFSLSAFGQQANLAVLDGDAGETAGVANPGSFRVSLSGVIVFDFDRTINLTVEPSSTAQANVDRDPIPATVDIPEGSTEGVITVSGIVDDNLVEGDETVIVTLLPGVGYTLDPVVANRTKTIIIKDNDVGQLSVTVDKATALEQTPIATANDGRFIINSDKVNGTGAPYTVLYSLSGSAIEAGLGDDYDVVGAATIADGSSSTGSIRIRPIDDTISESDETVILTVISQSNPLFAAGVPASGTVTILDNDCAAGDTAPAFNSTPTSLCDVASVNLNNYVSGTPPTGSTLRWSLVANPTFAQLLTTGQANAAGAGTYYAQYYSTTGACFSPSTAALTITINQTPNIGSANSTASCNTTAFGGTTTLDLDNTLSGSDQGGTWAFVSGPANPGSINSSNVINFNNDPAGNYVFSYTLTAPPCSPQTLQVTIPVSNCDPCIAGNTAPVLATNAPATAFCDAISVSLNSFTTSTAPPGTTLKWSTNSDPEVTTAHLNASQIANPLGGTYYAFFWDAANTCASPTLVVSLSLTTTPILTAPQDQERCGSGTVTFTASATGTPTINWYTVATGGTPVHSGPNFTTPELSQTTTYYVAATENSCASPRVAVEAKVVPAVSPGIPTDTSSCNDPLYGVTILNLNNQLAGEGAGTWAFTSGPETIVPGNGQNIDFNGRPAGVYVFTFTTTGFQAPCVAESASVSVSVSSCDTDDDGDGLFGGQEQQLGTDPQNSDSDNDGILDGVEVGDDFENPLDGDGDGIIDALDSNVADEDLDGVVDQLDPANDNPCIPNTLNGVCDSDGDDITDSEEVAAGSDPLDPCDPNAEHPNCQPINLEVLKTVDDPNADIGAQAVFTITLNNLDDRKARSIIVGDILETGFEYVSNTPSAGTYSVETGEWQIFEIDALGSETLQITVTIVEGGIYSNTAELLSSLPEDNTPENNSATVQINIDLPVGINLVVEKTARLGPDKKKTKNIVGLINDIDSAVEVEYFVKVINKSLSDRVSNIRVEDVFTLVDVIGIERVEVNVPTGSTFAADSGVWTIDNLEVNQEIELSYKVVFTAVGTFTNVATIKRSSPSESTSQDDDSTSSVDVEIAERNTVDIGIIFNEFSPNDDGINDVLKINRLRKSATGIDEFVSIDYNIDIFDRYGNLIFEALNMTDEKVWDGTWKGKEVPEGTYFYVLNIVIENEGSKITKGWIQLIR